MQNLVVFPPLQFMSYTLPLYSLLLFFAVSRTLLIHRARSFDDVSGNPLVKVVLNSLPYLKVTTSVFSVKINLSCSDMFTAFVLRIAMMLLMTLRGSVHYQHFSPKLNSKNERMLRWESSWNFQSISYHCCASDCHVLPFQTLAEAKRIMESRAASKVSDQCMWFYMFYNKSNLRQWASNCSLYGI